MNHKPETDLVALHSLSLLTKAFQIAIVLAQGMIINRLLGPAGRGLVETALSVGMAVGVLPNLGFVTSTVREMSASADPQRRSAIFAVSLIMRGLVSLPTVLILMGSASYIAAQVVQTPVIASALRIYGLTILITALFQTCEATLMGLQRFRQLFLFYIANAVVNLVAMVAMVIWRDFEGYFIGQAIGLALGTIALAWLALSALGWQISLPRSRQEWREISAALFMVAFVVYIAKILYAQYTGIGAVILKRFVSAEEVGYFSNAKQVALHLLNIAEAANIVNLSVMSQRFTEGLDAFRAAVQRNFMQLLSLILYAGAAAALFSRELVLILAGREFLPAMGIIPWFVVAFVLYSLVHIISAGVLVPTNSNWSYIIAYAILLGTSAPVVWILVANGWSILGATLGLLAGALAAVCYLLVSLWRRFRIVILNRNLAWVFLSLLPMWAACAIPVGLEIRALAFLIGSVGWVWVVGRLGILNIGDILKQLRGRMHARSPRVPA